ncbi:MAG: T9SS type A sorting domain-containing protein, partial [Bacteroidales bacterium]|nr:T9SS type A sorting domain-containing protein [Bacteroidales bacterium]
MTGKGNGVMSIGRNGETRDQGTWHQFTADLSAYAGQDIWVAIRHFNCTDMFILDVDEVTLTAPAKGNVNRAMWDLVYEFDGTSGYQYGVASDGTNIYTSSWSASSTSMFYKYDMQGNFIEEFNISGSGQCRGLTYDGQYFYGVANSSTVYCLDLANHTLVSQFTTPYGAMRCITYDPQRDGFWVVGNWSGALTLIDRTGAIVQAGPEPTSASDVAYYKDTDNVEHVYCFNNADNGVYDYNITTNTLGTSAVFNFNSNSAVTGSAGGCFVGAYDGKTCFFGDVQQSPQHIAIYELDGNGTPGPGPGPQPTGDVLGAMIFRDGELIAGPVTGNSFVDEGVEPGTYEYCIRVAYSNYAMACEQCEIVEVAEQACDPVSNLEAYYMNYQNQEGFVIDWTEPEGALEVAIYFEGESLGTIGASTHPIFLGFDGPMPAGDYTIGAVAIYDDCESEMVTYSAFYDEVNDNNIVNNIYPNPTNSTVTIEAEGMNHITVASVLGQVVYDADVDADRLELNLGQYNAGLYLVRISTVNGVSVKRVSVVK